MLRMNDAIIIYYLNAIEIIGNDINFIGNSIYVYKMLKLYFD